MLNKGFIYFLPLIIVTAALIVLGSVLVVSNVVEKSSEMQIPEENRKLVMENDQEVTDENEEGVIANNSNPIAINKPSSATPSPTTSPITKPADNNSTTYNTPATVPSATTSPTTAPTPAPSSSPQELSYSSGLITVNTECTDSGVNVFIIDNGVSTYPDGVWTYLIEDGQYIYMAYVGSSSANASVSIYNVASAIRGSYYPTMMPGATYIAGIVPAPWALGLPNLIKPPIAEVTFTNPNCES